MPQSRPRLIATAILAVIPAITVAQLPSNRPVSAAIAPAPPPYAMLADMILVSPVIADATIRSVAKIKGAEAANVAPGQQRLYVTADVGALIRGDAGLPPRVGYVVDVPLDSRGRPPALKKARMLIFARRVAGSADQLQLTGPAAQLGWTAAADSRVRRIAAELVAPNAPPAIRGVGNAFFVPGALPGESETQIFLQTTDGRPVSLSILRRPGEDPRWSVSLGEIVEEGAGPPAHDTLLWYRLACSLPRTLPDTAVAQLDADAAAHARDDYTVVLSALGPCVRTLTV